jgi:actinorhodin biosynthesis protein ActVIA
MKSRICISIALASVALFMVGLRSENSTAQSTRFSTDDYVQIQELYARFNQALDTAQPDAYVETWTDDGEFVGGRGPGRGAEARPPIKGRAALWDMAHRAGIGTRHMVANLVVTPKPGGATASAYLLLLNASNSPPTITETAIYQDTLVKTAQGWRFKRRVNWRDDDDISPFKPKPPGPPPPQ